MMDFLGSILGLLLSFGVFGLMLALVIYGFRSSEKAVNDFGKKRRAHDPANMSPDTATPEPRI